MTSCWTKLCRGGGDFNLDYYKNQKSDLFKAFDLLSDELSQKIFVNIFCLRVAPHLADFSYEDIYQENQYFAKDVLKLCENECFVDCGAYTGDTLEDFFNVSSGKFDNYYAFEMDFDNFSLLREKAEKFNNDKIECFNCGVWNEDTGLKYGKMASDDSYSIFNQRETEQVSAVKLDTVLKDKRVTFIKMDIEGAEMNALKGAEGIIKSQKPKAAICVYHKIEDLWQIPLFLKEMCPEYRFYIRHHAKYLVAETVCYAVI